MEQIEEKRFVATAETSVLSHGILMLNGASAHKASTLSKSMPIHLVDLVAYSPAHRSDRFDA